MELIGYSTPKAMAIRYSHPSTYAYKTTLDKIRNIPYDFKALNDTERKNRVKEIEAEIAAILLKPEKEWLKDSLDFELCALNLGYNIQ